jgi:hypothetical protein
MKIMMDVKFISASDDDDDDDHDDDDDDDDDDLSILPAGSQCHMTILLVV